MDGKGRAIDNIFIERFWRSVKYDYCIVNDTYFLKLISKKNIMKYIFNSTLTDLNF